MKRIIPILLSLILMSSIAIAGSIEDLDYKDKVCPFGSICDTNRQVDDNDVTIDADTLDGETAQTLTQKVKNAVQVTVSKGSAGWAKIAKFFFAPTKTEGIWTDQDALHRYLEVAKEYGNYENYIDAKINQAIEERCVLK